MPISKLFAFNPPGAHAMYLALRSPANDKAQKVREYCESLWGIYHYYADPQFLTEFPLRFHERWFEMYVCVTSLQNGAQVQSTSPPGPDTLINVCGRCVWIEAICGTGGAAGLPDSLDPIESTNGGYVQFDKIALRIRAAIEEKRRKFDRYLERGIVKPEDDLLIAVNIAKIPLASLDDRKCLFRALYGVGNQVITINRATMKAEGSSNEVIYSIQKASTGAPVGTQPFIDGSMPHIGGVIISSHSAVDRAFGNSPDLTLYPNMTAKRLVSADGIGLHREWVFEQSAQGWSGAIQDLTGAPER